MKKKSYNRQPAFFTMTELVFAMGIFVFVVGSFYSAVGAMGRYREMLDDQTEAVSVLDNSLERISCVKSLSCDQAKKIFRDEFAKSPLFNKEKIRTICEIREDNLYIGILKENGKALADIEIKLGRGKTL